MSSKIENDRFAITKNEDTLILTDKKTQKSRVLEPEDIDYVIDDNQKMRDSNVIDNYFRLKDDKSDRLVGADDVKKKFKSAMDEYIERTQEYL